MSKNNKQQSLFKDTEQFLCGCGCNQYGFRSKRGMKRLYINATHKKRAQRARIKSKRDFVDPLFTEAMNRLADKMAQRDYSSLWENISEDERWVVHLASQHPGGYDGFWRAVLKLTKRQDSWWNHNVL